MIKVIFQKPTENVIPNNKIPKQFQLKSGNILEGPLIVIIILTTP